MREKDELEDFIINGKLTIKELYELAKEGGFENNTLYFIGREKGEKFSNLYSENVITFGRGWSKNTVILKFEYEKEKHMDACPG